MKARDLSLSILMSVHHDGAYLNLQLKDRLKELNDEKDKRFVARLTYGVTEKRRTLERCVAEFTKTKKMPPIVVEVLYMGAYQILFMDSVPDRAAVDESVKLVKKLGFLSLSGVVNGTLRNISKNKVSLLSYKPKDDISNIMCVYNYNEKVAGEFYSVFKNEIKEAIEYQKNLAEKGIPFRIRKDYEKVFKQTAKLGYLPQKTIIPNTLILKNIGDITESPLYKEGLIIPQSLSSVLIARIVDAKEGNEILDICSAPGGKSFAIADSIDDKCSILACDIHKHRVDLISRNAKRLGIKCIKTECADMSKYQSDLNDKFDIVLVDAPCSGLAAEGKPEIALHTTIEDIENIVDVQRKILKNASKYVKKGGRIVYSTCTWTIKENEENIEWFLNENEEFRTYDFSSILPNELKKYVVNGSLRLKAHRDHMPSFFVAELTRGN